MFYIIDIPSTSLGATVLNLLYDTGHMSQPHKYIFPKTWQISTFYHLIFCHNGICSLITILLHFHIVYSQYSKL